jgi:hypothetical protein
MKISDFFPPSSGPNGCNPMRWDCTANGCFNTIMRPKIEVFADCFPRRISFSDVDGIVEINALFLMLEWKSSQYIPRGQEILYARLTQTGRTTVFVVCGNAQTMEVFSAAIFSKSSNRGWKPYTLDELKQQFCRWSQWAERGGRP